MSTTPPTPISLSLGISSAASYINKITLYVSRKIVKQREVYLHEEVENMSIYYKARLVWLRLVDGDL